MRSFSGVDINLRLNLSTSVLRTFGVMNAGRLGPNRIFFIPRNNSVNRIATAFCSYQESIRLNGSLFTSSLNALDKAEKENLPIEYLNPTKDNFFPKWLESFAKRLDEKQKTQ